jgi:hypothetical protein
MPDLGLLLQISENNVYYIHLYLSTFVKINTGTENRKRNNFLAGEKKKSPHNTTKTKRLVLFEN